jgi:hypothetical protein
LWPEFDRAAVLVLYRFELAEDTPLPTVLGLPIPATAGEPNAVAWQDSNQTLFDAAYTLETAGEWTLVRVELQQSRIGQVEYYAELQVVGDRRTYRFEWPGGLPIEQLAYDIQQPVAATDLQVTPSPDRQTSGAFGLTYHLAELGTRAAEAVWTIELSYRKPSPVLSAEALQPLGGPASSGGESAATSVVPWLLGGLGLAAVSGGLVYFLRSRPARQPVARRRRGPSARPSRRAAAVYCHECGTRAQPGDRFCRNCGTRLRVPR